MDPHPKKRSSLSFRLSSLFVLMAACGTLAAMTALVGRAEAPSSRRRVVSVLTAAAVSSVAAAGIGVIVGLHQHRRLRGAALGGLTGFVAGAVVGPLVFVPWTDFGSLLRISIAGSVIIVAAGLAARLMSAPRKRR